MSGNIEYNKMAIKCFEKMAEDAIIDCYDPEQDAPIWTYTVAELCDHVYHEGINMEKAIYGRRMEVLYIPKALRYQGKKVLKEHVKIAVLTALMGWAMEGNDFDFLEDGYAGAGERAEAWVEQEAD